MSEILKIHSCCVHTKGIQRVTIYDFQRKQIYFAPLSLMELISEENEIEIAEIKQTIDPDSIPIFEEYIAFLLENEIGFLCSKNESEYFPKMNTNYLFPAHISNIIIDTDTDTVNYLDEGFMKQLETLCCNYIQLRFFANVDLCQIQSILDFLNPTQIKAIEIVMPYRINYDKEKLCSFVSENKKVRNLFVINAPKNTVLQKEDYLYGGIVLSKTDVRNVLHCGVIQLEQFVLNIPHYTESLHHNTCLNRKIAIDVDGNIKNCPSMKESFGNIKDTTLEEAINKPGFKKYWNITKDQITKCKDCEFRHVCTDCRAYLENPDDIYAAPLKCGYNPYTCEWEEWSTNPLKQKAIDYYGMREILNNE